MKIIFIAFLTSVLQMLSVVQAQRVNNFEKNKFSDFKISKRAKAPNNLENNYDVKFYKIDLRASDTSTYISGNVTINAVVQNVAIDTLVFELIDTLIVDSIIVNGVNYNFIHYNDEIKIIIPSPLQIGTSFSAIVYYHGFGSSYLDYFGITNDNSVTWTISEPWFMSYWAPCKQFLDDKADSVYVFITTDSYLKVASNGLLTAVVPLPDNKVRYEWESHYIIDYYLISFAVADYFEYNIYAYPSGGQDPVFIQNFILSNYQFAQNVQYIDKISSCIELLSDLYGPYPFKNEKYGQCLVQTSGGGGMENQTMTTVGDFSFDLLIHELGHSWFGDNVTCKTWQDVWLCEGFATYTEYLGYEYLESQSSAYTNVLQQIQSSALSQATGSIYVPLADATDFYRIFDSRLSYCKGASIIHQIRFELNNDSVFFKTLQNYQSIYAGKTATGEDFKQVLETTSGKDFDDFFDEWYYGEGYPIYNIYWYQLGDTLFINSVQTTSSTVTPLFKISMEYKLKYSGYDTTIRVFQNSNSQIFKIYVPYKVVSLVADPNKWVLKKVNSVTQGISENNNSDIFISCVPNPFNDNVLIQFYDNAYNHKIELTDITGNILYQSQIHENLFNLNTQNIAKGVYLLKIDNGNNIFIKKLIKQ